MIRFKCSKRSFVCVYNKSDPEFTWGDAKREAERQLLKFRDSKTYKDMLIKKQFLEILSAQIQSVKKREDLLLTVIRSIDDDDAEIVNKKG